MSSTAREKQESNTIVGICKAGQEPLYRKKHEREGNLKYNACPLASAWHRSWLNFRLGLSALGRWRLCKGIQLAFPLSLPLEALLQ